jgi:hypothetical protein
MYEHRFGGAEKIGDHTEKEYYNVLKPTFLRELDQILNAGKDIMIQEYGRELADELISEVYAEFEQSIPDIPYIGGDENPFTINLVESTQLLAFYTVLQRKRDRNRRERTVIAKN